jgi:MSHA biogenesis protein MshL
MDLTMPSTLLSRSFVGKIFGLLLLCASLTFLSGCDLAKNQLKIDRGTDMEVQDYRDALAQRLPDVDGKTGNDAPIPEMKSYMATPMDSSTPMPLVSIAVNQSVPLRDVLYELAEQANYDMELDPRITGSIIFTARNRPFDQVIDKIAESAGLRYKFEDDSVKVELDTPYHKIYKINYLSYTRTNTSSISNDVAVVSGEGADTGSRFRAESTSEADFWGEMDNNLQQILYVNRDAGTLRTARDPRIQAVAEQPAPVEPVILTADGEIARQSDQPNVQVQAPNAVLRVDTLPEDELSGAASGNRDEDAFASRYSINKQAGLISVFANERLHKQVAKYLSEVEKSVSSQVLIEAKVLEVQLSDEFSAGIDWQMFNIFDRTFNFGVDTVTAAVAPALNPLPTTPISMTGSYVSGDFNAAIQAISRFGTVRGLASPRLTVLNNQSAVLNVARNQVYFEIDVTTTSTANAGITTDVDSQIRNVPEGVLINVQPSIDLDANTVTMAVRPTVTRIEGSINDPAVAFASAGLAEPITSPIPIVNVQEFDSIIRMNSGQAVVMGGLIQDRTTSIQGSVPVLGEMPLVGALFRNQVDKISKTELVVLLKATIVEGGNNVHKTDKDLYRTFSQDRRPIGF